MILMKVGERGGGAGGIASTHSLWCSTKSEVAK